jgi:hypothetical protein
MGVQKDKASNQTVFRAHFVIENPTGYSGFVVKSFDLGVYFVHQNATGNVTLFRSIPMLGSEPVDSSIGPNSKISSDVTIYPWPAESNSFVAFNGTYYPRILAHTIETVELITFLEPVIGRLRVTNQEDLQFL